MPPAPSSVNAWDRIATADIWTRGPSDARAILEDGGLYRCTLAGPGIGETSSPFRLTAEAFECDVEPLVSFHGIWYQRTPREHE